MKRATGRAVVTTFFRVYDRAGRTNAPVSWADHKMYVWVPNTRTWHRERELEIDYLIERQLTFEPLPVSDVPAAMDAAQRVDERSEGWLIDEYRAQPPEDRRSSADLGVRI